MSNAAAVKDVVAVNNAAAMNQLAAAKQWRKRQCNNAAVMIVVAVEEIQRQCKNAAVMEGYDGGTSEISCNGVRCHGAQYITDS